MSICFYPCAYDADQNLYTVMRAAGDEGGDFEFSLCNATAWSCFALWVWRQNQQAFSPLRRFVSD
jgi:hypothetical protein